MGARDYASCAPEGSALLYGAVWAFRAARFELLGRDREALAAFIRAGEWVPALGRSLGTCGNCGELARLLILADEEQRGDGGAVAQCAPCWREWERYGRVHVPEAWEDGETFELVPATGGKAVV